MEPETLPSRDDVIRIYEDRLRRDGEPNVGSLAQPNFDCLDGVLAATEMYAAWGDGIDQLHVAACLLCKLARRHCLPNANKRTAWDSAMRVLIGEGLTVDESPEVVSAFVTRIVVERLESSDVVKWMAERLSAAEL